uniref:Uncharacterized protein n=1 Tax=Anguilla anguilla TaxID=7936 RepID=A0A0E9Q5M9_ANGAN
MPFFKDHDLAKLFLPAFGKRRICNVEKSLC